MKSGKILGNILIFGALIGAGIGISTTSYFERVAPQVLAPQNIYWNTKTPLTFGIKDNNTLKSIRVSVITANQSKEIMATTLSTNQTTLSLTPSQLGTLPSSFIVKIFVQDGSWWNFFRGNETVQEIKVQKDVTSPVVTLLSHSYSLSRGGSALVVFSAHDEKLKDIVIHDSQGHKFYATPFYKQGYYAALVAWDVKHSLNDFRLSIEAIDEANNKSVIAIPYYLIDKNYKVSTIKLADTFLNGKILELSSHYHKDNLDGVNRFKFINETLRQENENLIHQLTNTRPKVGLRDFSIAPFYPLKNGAVVAHYGDHRLFTYNNAQVSESWHMGIDLASFQASDIVASNGGKVIFNADNGIFGIVPVLEHGLGLYSLYGHCSQSLVQKGETIQSGSVIAKSGVSGLALGDHLHFGMIVQGIDVTPIEWMDGRWIKLNITDILQNAKQIIESRR